MEPCRANSHRTGREKAVLLFHRMDRVKDKVPTRLPSSSVSTYRRDKTGLGAEMACLGIAGETL